MDFSDWYQLFTYQNMNKLIVNDTQTLFFFFDYSWFSYIVLTYTTVNGASDKSNKIEGPKEMCPISANYDMIQSGLKVITRNIHVICKKWASVKNG